MNSLETHASGVSWTLASAAVPRPPATSPHPCARSSLREFLVYALASFLLSWSSQLQQLEFQDLIMFLQVGEGCGRAPVPPHLACSSMVNVPHAGTGHPVQPRNVHASQSAPIPLSALFPPEQRPPTAAWTEQDMEVVLSRAFMWRSSFKGATSHFS